MDFYCYDCHGYGEKKGGLTLDSFGEGEEIENHELWGKVLKRVRFGLMPPHGEDQLEAEELKTIIDWIKSEAFEIDPEALDPGAVVLRRLNRNEYRNSVRDLIGVEVDTDALFPPDDSGEGFDNIGSVLTISPMLLEKYLDVAQLAVEELMGNLDTWEGSGSYLGRYQGLADLFAGETGSDLESERTLLEDFVSYMGPRVFRRPLEASSKRRLTELGHSVLEVPGKGAIDGASQVLVAMLASPRFIFRYEGMEELQPGERYPLVDEWSLASRLSYFLWSSMPDETLLALAASGRLRENLDTQVGRLLEDERSDAFVRNFAGQWLHARDIELVAINAFDLFLRENPVPEVVENRRVLHRLAGVPASERTEEEQAQFQHAVDIVTNAFAQPRPKLSSSMRRAMREETELLFEYILREERNVLDLIDSNYAFLNEELAEHYGIEGVEGEEMRRVALPADSPRGGVLTQGTILAVTSNPTRTSPVKRGVFILDNILGTPPSPPPPNISSLEDVADADELSKMSLRETLAIHREKPLCSSCHNQMDPLGLALENFNAMGRWRDSELGQEIDASGTLISGESFETIQELKRILRSQHSYEFFHCLSEKLLTFALGRELEYYDTETVDRLVEVLQEKDGSLQALIRATIDSVPFQRGRGESDAFETEQMANTQH
ncbi:DUF1592 domain-containing protein [Pelagicoccus sp. SDUM812005]|uniref:DUF1592 domain-containing protein n=1 Tax=Pelagicoccus sp. SDUM812005 TaxID=3041257 RepID=UPI00280EA2D4|nr:DUF1592 domain-containing protein [Pelagicoccus sp. SDUM812005]MDQ8179198.1 DUF1592 domain-containing protein [Pelagicoccus sp. SDUM812005]